MLELSAPGRRTPSDPPPALLRTRRMRPVAARAFTLVELLVALAVAAILLGTAVPSFVDTVRDSRIATQYNALVAALYLARSEAVKSSRLVAVCSRATDTRCGDADGWKNGWIVFVDAGGAFGDTAVTIDPADGDTILRVEGAQSGDNTIVAYATGLSGTDDPTAFVRYRPRGDAHWQTGSFRICDAARGAAASRVANVALTGDIRPGRRSGAEAAPRDAGNREIVCPAPPA